MTASAALIVSEAPAQAIGSRSVRLYPTSTTVYSQIAKSSASERASPMVAEFIDLLRFS